MGDMAAPTRPSLKVSCTMTYRGATRTFSNRYFFNGGTPATIADWTTLSDAVVTAQHNAMLSSATITSTTGYEANSELPVFTKAYSTVGVTPPFTGRTQSPGDACALVKFTTDQRTTRNHPIYLFKYFKPVACPTAGPADTLEGGLKTNIDAYMQSWITGFSDGTLTYTLSGPRGAAALTRLTSTNIHHRDFRN